MRIISGKYGGRILKTVRTGNVRPAMDRVKGTIFNILQNKLDLVGARVLDLFAGTGSLGFEAISRGAASTVFVDDDDKLIVSIKKTAVELNCIESCAIIRMDAIDYIGSSNDVFDLIFADPPYAYERTSKIPSFVFERNLVKLGGFLIIEHTRQTSFPASHVYHRFVEKQFGTTRVSFFVHPP